MRGKGKNKNSKDKNKPKSFVVSAEEKRKAIASSLEYSQINKEVDGILYWAQEQEEKLAKNQDHKALLFLDFRYANKSRMAIVDTVLRILGTRLLTQEERADQTRPLSIGLQATNRPHLYIYYNYSRPEGGINIQEKYFLLVSKEMKLPKEASLPEKNESQIQSQTGSSLNKNSPPGDPKPENPKKDEKRPPGIFKTMNEIFLGDEEQNY
jgi:hypothetical protein